MSVSDKVRALPSEGTLLPALLSTTLVAAQTARFRTQIDSSTVCPTVPVLLLVFKTQETS